MKTSISALLVATGTTILAQSANAQLVSNANRRRQRVLREDRPRRTQEGSLSIALMEDGGSDPAAGTAKSSKSGKAAKTCNIEDLEGKFKLDYDFFLGAARDYVGPDSDAALTFSKPESEGEGVMLVNYCFSDEGNDLVAVKTGFERDGIIPITIVEYEDEVTVPKIYNEGVFHGEYNCKTEELMVGCTGYFDSNAFGIKKPAVKDANLELDGEGCLV